MPTLTHRPLRALPPSPAQSHPVLVRTILPAGLLAGILLKVGRGVRLWGGPPPPELPPVPQQVVDEVRRSA